MVSTRRTHISDAYVTPCSVYQSSNAGVLTFIYLSSLGFAFFYKYPIMTDGVHRFLKQHVPCVYDIDYNINSYNIIDVSLICALYHYVAFFTIHYRNIVYRVTVGGFFCGCVIYFIS